MNTRLMLLVILLPSLASAVTLDSWMDMQTGGDSLSLQPGRLEVGGMLSGNNWTITLHEKFSHGDSTGLVPVFLNKYSQTDLDIRFDAGPVTINPDLCWTVDIGDKPEMVLPRQAGVACREGFIRPGLGIEARVSDGIHLFARGLYWNRDLKQADEYDLAWTETRISGGFSWEMFHGHLLTVSGLNHRTNSDFIDYESSWSRFNLSISAENQPLPVQVYIDGDITYSLYQGTDYSEADLADRLTSRIRLTRMVAPSVSVNTTFESVLDFDDGVTRSACTSAESRIIYHFMRSREIPSAIVLSGKISRSSIRTERATLFSRINLFKGLSLLLNAEARVTPTSVAGADDSRKRVVFGPGLEYQLGTTLRVWGIIEQERTNLQENENWWRIRMGLELYPGSLNL